MHSSTNLRLLRPQLLVHCPLCPTQPRCSCFTRVCAATRNYERACVNKMQVGRSGGTRQAATGLLGPHNSAGGGHLIYLENRHKKGGRKLAFVLPEIKFLQSKRRGRPQAAAPGQSGWGAGRRGPRVRWARCARPAGEPSRLCGVAAARGRGSRGNRWCWGKNGTDLIRDSASTAGLRPSGRAACMCVVARCLAAGVPQAARARVPAQFSPARQ